VQHIDTLWIKCLKLILKEKALNTLNYIGEQVVELGIHTMCSHHLLSYLCTWYVDEHCTAPLYWL